MIPDSECPTGRPSRVPLPIELTELQTLHVIQLQLAQLPAMRALLDTLVLEMMGKTDYPGLKADVAALKVAHERRVWSHPLVVAILLGVALVVAGCALYGALRG